MARSFKPIGVFALLLIVPWATTADGEQSVSALVNIASPEWGSRASASSAYPPAVASRAVDGQVGPDHSWFSKDNAELPQWLELRFPRPRRISEVRVRQANWSPGMYRTRDFTVEARVDGARWQEIGRGRLAPDDAAEAHLSFAPLIAQALRITITSSYNTLQTCGLGEVEVMALMDEHTTPPFPGATSTLKIEVGRASLTLEPGVKPDGGFWLPAPDNTETDQRWTGGPHELRLKLEALPSGARLLRWGFASSEAGEADPGEMRIALRTSYAGVYKMFAPTTMHQQAYGVDLPFAMAGHADAGHSLPVFWMQDTTGRNTLTIGVLDQIGRTRYKASTYNPGNGGEAPGIANSYVALDLTRDLASATTESRFTDALYINDSDTLTWFEALHDYSRTVDAERGYDPPPLPAAETDALWHSWYAHGDVIDREIMLADARLAAGLGFRAFQIDAGWNVPPGVSYSLPREGDYTFDPERFPDPRSMFDEIHELGLSVMLHVSPLVMGAECANAATMGDAVLRVDGKRQLHMDPRLRKTHEFLTATWTRLLTEHPIDGLWYDFLELPEGADAPPEGMDVIEPDMQRGYDLLLRTLFETARAVRPDIMIAIRRSTANLAAKRYATQMWPMDTPQDYNMNRRDVVMLRWLGEGIMTHSCCTSWPISESPDNVARQMASVVLAGAPAVSVPLTISPESHNAIMRAWLGFYRDRTDALAHGRLTPLLPTPPSAAIRVEGDEEAFFGFFEAVPGLVGVTRPFERVTVVNAFSARLVTRVEGLAGRYRATVYDREWNPIEDFDSEADPQGGIDLNVTGPSGCFSVVLTRR